MSDRHLTPDELSTWLDGELHPEHDTREHLRTCHACGEALDVMRRVRQAARAGSPPVPTDAMWKTISARLDAGPVPRESWWSRLVWALGHPNRGALATLGTVTALALIVVIVHPKPEGPVIPPPEQAAPAPAAPAVPAPAAPAGKRVAAPKAPARAVKKTTAKPAPVPAESAAAQTRRALEAPAEEGGGSTGEAARPANQSFNKQAGASAAAPSRRAAAAPAAAPAPAMAPAAVPEAPFAPSSDNSTLLGAPPQRPMFTSDRFKIEADTITHPTPDQVLARGHVAAEILSAIPPSLVYIDGLSSTVTGTVHAASADVDLAARTIRILTH